MSTVLSLEDVGQLAPAGYFIALRIGFAFPMEEVNALPPAWVEHYTRQRYMLFDPVVRWAYAHTGVVHWNDLSGDDPKGILDRAREHGLHHGITISVFDGNAEGQRSFGSFSRSDRPFIDMEIKLLEAFVHRRHREMAPPTNLTEAELSALRMVKEGMRLKQIAFELDVTEGAVKQRLKNAKGKLGAKTSTQAATMAAQYGII
ncbi:autoinducer binding domain-containing protein [Yoonia sp. R2331]|uniref:autoinducer binding domain-containing protein n=1 Tax=Yoonia sp. R2331 TaxID=3237238 RepID=UPI0034E61A2D